MPNPSFTENYGTIGRLYPDANGIYFTLLGGQTAMNPQLGYYLLLATHGNYPAMVDLLYLAAEQRWTVKVQTQDNLDANGFAEVAYLVVDF